MSNIISPSDPAKATISSAGVVFHENDPKLARFSDVGTFTNEQFMCETLNAAASSLSVVRVLRALLTDIAKITPTAGMPKELLKSYKDVMTIATSTVDWIISSSQTNPASRDNLHVGSDGVVGSGTFMMSLAETVAWSISRSLKHADKEQMLKLCDVTAPSSADWPLAFVITGIYGMECKPDGQLGGATGRMVESFKYVPIVPRTGLSIGSTYDLVLHVDNRSLQRFHMAQIPFGALLQHMFYLTTVDLSISNAELLVLTSTLLFCFHELVCCCRNYTVLVNQWTAFKCALGDIQREADGSSPRKDCFDFLLSEVSSTAIPLTRDPAGTVTRGALTYNRFFNRARAIYSDICMNYYDANKGSTLAALAGGVDPAQFAGDPEKLNEFLKRFTGSSGFDMSKIAEMPIFNSVKDLIMNATRGAV